MTDESEEYADMGAQWLHGDIGNPLYDELLKRGLISYKEDYLHNGLSLLCLSFNAVPF